MEALEIIREVESLGISVAVNGERLEVRPGSKLSGELAQEIRAHKPDIMRVLQSGDDHLLDCPCIDCSITGPKYANPIESAGEVREMARAILNPEGIDYGPAPVRPGPPGRDPLVHTDTDKARWFRGVRESDLAKREER